MIIIAGETRALHEEIHSTAAWNNLNKPSAGLPKQLRETRKVLYQLFSYIEVQSNLHLRQYKLCLVFSPNMFFLL